VLPWIGLTRLEDRVLLSASGTALGDLQEAAGLEQQTSPATIVEFNTVPVGDPARAMSAQAQVSWGSAQSTSGVSDITLTGGDIISAFNGGSSDVTVNGVHFAAADLLPGAGTAGNMLAGATTGDANYNTLLDQVDFGGGTGSTPITLGDGDLLTVGETYTVQVWYTDLRSRQSGRVMRYGDGESPENTVDLTADAGSFGQYVVGTFTADATTQTLTMAPQGFNNSHFNALLLQRATFDPPGPLDPKGTAGWTIDTQEQWTAAYASGSFNISDGEVNPNSVGATFESRLQPFTQKQKFESVTFIQTDKWGAAKWDSAGNIGPSNNAPVFVSPAEDDYWLISGNGQKYHSTDMVNWTSHGSVGHNWVTSAEYKDGEYYIYYDVANDEDPYLIVDDDLTDGAQTEYGKVFDDTTWGSDMAVFRDIEGENPFHIIFEDWSAINARQHSWDSQIAGHTSSPDGITGWVNGEHVNPIDEAGSPTGDPDVYYDHPMITNPEHPEGWINYTPHDGPLDAWGDYELIRVGDTYYLFCDDDPESGPMGVGVWRSDDMNGAFTYDGQIDSSGHPDPTVGFAEGEFWLITQRNADRTSGGPWVDAIQVDIGVDTDGDDLADAWTGWQDISEEYGRIDGFAKVFSVDPAVLDLSGLPEGYGVQFRFNTSDIAAVMDSVNVESTSVPVNPPPTVEGIALNGDRTVSGIEPSGTGVQTIEVTFSEAVNFTSGDVTVQEVTFPGGSEDPGDVLTPTSITGDGTDTMTITLDSASVVDTWVKVTLDGGATITDLAGTALDGEAPSGGAGRGYLYDATDLPTGDGTAGGDAVFYVGSLRGDLYGGDLFDPDPNGELTDLDVAGFISAYQGGDLDADFYGGDLFDPVPDGNLDDLDVAGFIAVHQAGASLDPLPTSWSGASAPSTSLPPESPILLSTSGDRTPLDPSDESGEEQRAEIPEAVIPALKPAKQRGKSGARSNGRSATARRAVLDEALADTEAGIRADADGDPVDVLVEPELNALQNL